jgi:class 3 adenylate cyclase
VATDGSEPQSLDGERKTVTALFADIKGSTELMRDLDPEDAHTIVDPVLQDCEVARLSCHVPRATNGAPRVPCGGNAESR